MRYFAALLLLALAATANATLTANAGPDQAVGVDVPVILDGSGSSTSSGTLTYFWHQTSGSHIDFVGFDRVKPVVTPPTPAGTYVFTLTVSTVESPGTTATDTMTITVTAPTGIARYVDGSLSATCSGSTYSIANRNCSGSDGPGYKTLPEAATAVAAGDTVYVRDGTYTDAFTQTTVNIISLAKSGTATQPIRLQNYNGEAVTLQGAGSFSDVDLNENGYADGVAHSGNRETLAELDGDYIQFIGFELANSEEFGLNLRGSFCFLSELDVHDIWATAIYANEITSVTHQGNVFRYVSASHARHGYGTIAQTLSTSPMRWNNNVLADSIFYENGHETNGQKVLPASSSDHGIISDVQGGGNSGGAEHSKQFYDPNPTDNHADNNYMVRLVTYRNTDDGMATDSDDLDMEDDYSLANGPDGGNGVKYYKPGKNTVSRGMFSYANAHRGWELRGIAGTPFQHYNCSGIRDWQNGVWADSTAYDLRNNLCAFNVLADFSSGILGNVTSTNNWAEDGTGNTGLTGDPQLVNDNMWTPTLVAGRVDPFPPGNASNNSDDYPSDFLPLTWPAGSSVQQRVAYVRDEIKAAFTPKAGSPLIDAGEVIAGYDCPTADDDPVTPCDPTDPRRHWNGAAPDIGAFEYSAALSTGKIISLLRIGLDFGNVPVGSSMTGTLRITNTGDTNLTVTGVTYSPDTVFTGTYSGVIAPGASHDVTITFAPTSTTAYSDTLTVASDKTSGTNTAAVTGTGVAGNGNLPHSLYLGRIMSLLRRP